MDEKSQTGYSIHFISTELISKKNINHRNILLHYKADGSLHLSSPNSASIDLSFPVSMMLSIEDAMPSGSASSSPSSSSSSSSSSLILHHVVRSPRQFYELGVWKSTIQFIQRNSVDEAGNGSEEAVFDAVRAGIDKAKRNRPNSVLAIINPNSGWGKGVQNYQKLVEPIFDAARIKSKMISTRNAQHIKEIIDEEDLNKYDGVLAGGGDGTVNHLLSALTKKMLRNAEKEADANKENPNLVKPDLAVGTLPVGSGNGTALSTNMTLDLTTIACNVVLGYKLSFDLISIHDANEGFKLVGVAHLLAGYSMIFEQAQKMENHRRFGPLRYFGLFCNRPLPISIDGISFKLHREPMGQVVKENHGDHEDLPLLQSHSACGMVEQDGVITPCPICTLNKNNIDGDDNDNNDGNDANDSGNGWVALPAHFAGPKGTVWAMNIPSVPIIDFEDPRFNDVHFGDGTSAVFSEVDQGKLHYLKLITGGYSNIGSPDGSPKFQEPNWCRNLFNELMIELDPTDTSTSLMADGEPLGKTSKTYMKVHRGFLTFFGTGKIAGHMKPAGLVSCRKMKCAIFMIMFIVVAIVVLILVGIGYLIQYLA